MRSLPFGQTWNIHGDNKQVILLIFSANNMNRNSILCCSIHEAACSSCISSIIFYNFTIIQSNLNFINRKFIVESFIICMKRELITLLFNLITYKFYGNTHEFTLSPSFLICKMRLLEWLQVIF